jgi:hypothetical protein
MPSREHQIRCVADAAILHRYRQAGGPPSKKSGLEREARWFDLMKLASGAAGRMTEFGPERLQGRGGLGAGAREAVIQPRP